ncbi:ATP-binding protein [Saccharopolyspora phatthalungensis]|uniref:Tetratricopeptide (TPR) repeat protein/transcriptional regulator with XRE-family HTH domain n=1 Tax=Saccharopolyspora phatthalungensis TaxID=664693 RepID=A0A840Q9N5_9PSEU|nr:tetratricopeptide repeat protein [Saccharopolyspora phatthalungensis]MBB5159252.1 tetratricopeptide (TPR) repeat protein/transcriptional regulator with XRE-family HTH domain [Saccharopolyspora phatthalungensis]
MGESSNFGAELRRLRRRAGLSLSTLAARTHYSKGFLSKVETGAAPPSPALAALCEAELGATGLLVELLPDEPARRRTRPDTRPSGLPALSAHFVGRLAGQRSIRAALEADGGVCVVSGMGGVGKTELAVRCAHRLESGFTDGCLFVDLRGHTPGRGPAEPAEVLDRLLRMLDVPVDEIPADVDDRAALYRSRLRGRSVLLVFDNAAGAAQVRPLLPAEPKCRVLVTSRNRLPSLDGATHVSLDLLSDVDAARLFAAIADVDAEGAMVRSIVERCGRLPLAVRIAAARLRAHPAWDLAELHRRLTDEADWFGEIDDGERSLTAALELSVRDLGAAESRMLGLLSLHPGGDFDVCAAAALTGVAPRAADRLAERLHGAFLLSQPAKDRFALHDIVRAFARDSVLAGMPEQQKVAGLRRLLDAMLATAALADRLLIPGRYQPEWARHLDPPEPLRFAGRAQAMAWFRVEWQNLVELSRAAQQFGEYERCWHLAFVLRGFFFETKLWDPWIAVHRRAREAAAELGDRWALAGTNSHLGVALADRGDLAGAAECYRDALDLYREIGDEHGEITVRANCGWVEHFRGDHETAVRNLSFALGHYERVGNVRNAAITRRGIALAQTALRQYPEAADAAERALAEAEELALEADAVRALNCLAWVHFEAGEHRRAAAAYQRAADRAGSQASHYEQARALTGLGNVAACGGRGTEAVALWRRADEAHGGLEPAMVAEARVRLRFRVTGGTLAQHV